MTTLRDLLLDDSREPSVNLRLAGRTVPQVLRVRAAAAYGSDGIGSGTVVLRSPPVSPEQGQAIAWSWGYNGLHVPGFTGYVVDVQKISYPDTWELGVRDVLWLASREQRAIATDPLNSITANAAIEQILASAGLTRISLPTIPRPSGGTWTLGTLTPVSWERTTALAACQEICKAGGYALYADAGGTVRATQIERRPSDSAAWSYLDGRDFLEDAVPTRRRDGSQVRNRITVRGANTGVQGAQLFDTYLAPHALYPDVVASEEYSSSLLEDIADVTAVAERLTGLLNRKPDTVTFGALFNPYVALAQTIGVRDPYVGLSSVRTYFVYSLDTELDLEHGRARQTITGDGGLGDSGYTLVPPPLAVILVTALVAETLDGDAVVEIFLDGSGSISNTEGEIAAWAWSTSTTTYGTTPDTASGAKAMFIYPGATATAEISLTVMDTSSKTDTATITVNLAGDELTELSSATISLALGSAWAVSPDGGATWNVEVAGDATLVPESGPLLATVGTGATELRLTEDGLASASTTLADLGGTITALASTPGTTRTWAAVGTALWRSTDQGATFSLWGTLPAAISAVLEDPAVENSVFVLAGADMYHATTPTPGTGWVVLYAGPTGATARQLVRGQSGATTWIAYTGTFIGSPLQRVEGLVAAVWPLATSPDVTEVRAIALSPDETTVYAWDAQGRGWSVVSETGIATANGADLPVGVTAQHALHDPDDSIVYLATFGGTAGTTYKYFPLADLLAPFYVPASGQQAHRIGLGDQARAQIAALILPWGASGDQDKVWRYDQSAGAWIGAAPPQAGWYWACIAANPFNAAREWIVLGNSDDTGVWLYNSVGAAIRPASDADVAVAYHTSDAGATWTPITLTGGGLATNTGATWGFGGAAGPIVTWRSGGDWLIGGGYNNPAGARGRLWAGSGASVTAAVDATDHAPLFPAATTGGRAAYVYSVDNGLEANSSLGIADPALSLSEPAGTSPEATRLDTLPLGAGVVMIDADGDVYGGAIGAQPTLRVGIGTGVLGATSAAAAHGVYVARNGGGLVRITDLLSSPVATLVAAGATYSAVRSGRRERLQVAALSRSVSDVSITHSIDGTAWSVVVGPTGMTSANTAAWVEIIKEST